YKDLVGTRKEAQEPLAKYNARDESRSHVPVDGKKRHQKSLHDFRPPLYLPLVGGEKVRSILLYFAPSHISSNSVRNVGKGLLFST
ncbi:MAG: hypothetical protein WCX28_05965, partial [Bacteriovoracaceae bacterium]